MLHRLPFVSVVLAAVAGLGCPPGNPHAPRAEEEALAAIRRLVERERLADVADGPGAGEAFEQFIERVPAAKAVAAAGRVSERRLRENADVFSYEELLGNPDASRGKIVFAYVIIGEIKELPFKSGGERLMLLIGGTPQGEFYAFIYPARSGRGRFYGGDVVWCSGVFVKVFSFTDGAGKRRRAPLLAGPPPTYTGDWFPYRPLLRELGLETFFPVSVNLSPPPPMLFMEVDASGIVSIGGMVHGRDELKRRIDGLAEASAVRGLNGAAFMRVSPSAPPAEIDEIKALIAQRGLSAVVKQSMPPKSNELMAPQPGE
ncbi:MAG TPA: hypothetical protein ENN09_04600 [Planctomycetes bacterium]|nr:hypothetical protein [Planctomycetota bacterium]